MYMIRLNIEFISGDSEISQMSRFYVFGSTTGCVFVFEIKGFHTNV